MQKVQSESYRHEVHYLSEKEIFFDRVQRYGRDHSEVDVYADFWSFLFSDVRDKGLKIQFQNEELVFSGKITIWVPPHALIHWRVRATVLHWFAYSNGGETPKAAPSAFCVYQINELPTKISPQWISSFIQVRTPDWSPSLSTVNPHSLRLKILLDQEYRSNKSLGEYGRELGLSKEWLIRYFKRDFGVTPIVYRNKKRLMQTFFSLHTQKEKILTLSQDMGFSDLKHFNHLFKRAVGLPPSEFRI